MSFSMADAKRIGRRAVNDLAAVPIRFFVYDKIAKTYGDAIEGPTLKARYHSVIKREGLIEGEGGERMFEIDRVVYDRDAFTELAIEPKRLDRIEFIDYEVSVLLDVKKPHDGPVEETWLVTME
jgi:hypothetical protein